MRRDTKLCLMVLAICMVLCTLWFGVRYNKAPVEPDNMLPESIDVSETKSEISTPILTKVSESDSREEPVQAKRIARKKSMPGLTMAASSRSRPDLDSTIEVFFVHPSALNWDSAHKLNRRQVKRLHTMLGDVEFVDNWLSISHLIAINGNSDIASEHLLDFIEHYETPQDADARRHGKILWARFESIQYLGWSKGKRAEEFLIKAYEKPSELSALKEIHQHPRDDQITVGFADFRIDNLALSKVIFALLEFDHEKYSPMIEAGYRKAAKDLADLGMNPGEASHLRFPREVRILDDLHTTYLNQLIKRDLRHEHGARTFAEMSSESRGKLETELYAFIRQHPDADAWWGTK